MTKLTTDIQNFDSEANSSIHRWLSDKAVGLVVQHAKAQYLVLLALAANDMADAIGRPNQQAGILARVEEAKKFDNFIEMIEMLKNTETFNKIKINYE